MTKKKSKIHYSFFIFFAVIFTVNCFYIYISKKTWSGLATEDSYQKGLNYNDTLKKVAKQKELGWHINTTFKPISEARGVVYVEIKDANSQPIVDADVDIEFVRPTKEGVDFVQKISFENAVYKAEVKFPLKGQWDFRVTAIRGQNSFQEVKRHIIQ